MTNNVENWQKKAAELHRENRGLKLALAALVSREGGSVTLTEKEMKDAVVDRFQVHDSPQAGRTISINRPERSWPRSI